MYYIISGLIAVPTRKSRESKFCRHVKMDKAVKIPNTTKASGKRGICFLRPLHWRVLTGQLSVARQVFEMRELLHLKLFWMGVQK